MGVEQYRKADLTIDWDLIHNHNAAVDMTDLDAVKAHETSGGVLNDGDHHTESMLVRAVRGGNKQVVSYLVKCNVYVISRTGPNNTMPLRLAPYAVEHDMLCALLPTGVLPTHTPAMYAHPLHADSYDGGHASTALHIIAVADDGRDRATCGVKV